MGWGWERVGAVAYVVAFPILFFTTCSAYRCVACMCPCAKLRVGPRMFVFLSLVWCAALGFTWALWAHWVPCRWLDCDLGEGDDGTLRGQLLFASWPAFTLFFAATCYCGSDLGPIVVRRESSHTELVDV